MRQIILTFIAGLAVTSVGHAQMSQSDSQTLQAILSELRQIRSELHDQQARNQTMQVQLFQMQTYQTAINRATQRTDDARSKLSDVREGERHFSADISRDEDSLRDAQDEADKKRLAADIDRSKRALASFKTMEQDRIAVLQQAEAQLQKAEDGFDFVQNELGQLLKGPR
jgi:DNA repair exonuclease SbcCD ATPase subunit